MDKIYMAVVRFQIMGDVTDMEVRSILETAVDSMVSVANAKVVTLWEDTQF